MSALRRVLTNLVTFGLAHRLEADIRTQEENVQRMQAGEPRIVTTPTRDLSDTLWIDPFWRQPKERR